MVSDQYTVAYGERQEGSESTDHGSNPVINCFSTIFFPKKLANYLTNFDEYWNYRPFFSLKPPPLPLYKSTEKKL